MRVFLLPVLLLLGLSSFAQHPNADVLAYDLIDAMEQKPQAFHPVYMILTDQVDVLQLRQEFEQQRSSLQERTAVLCEALQTKATQSQKSLLDLLESSDGVRQESIQPYWITNILFAEMQAEVIHQLSGRADVAWIGIDHALAISAVERVEAPNTYIEDGIEPGLAVVKAPELWAMGYSGYGRKVMIIDTGTDILHPALQTKFEGNYRDYNEAWFDVDPTDPFDCNDHGTHVCGTVVGLDRLNNDTIGVAYNGNWTASPPIACYRNAEFSGTQRIIASFEWAMDPDGDPSTTEDMPDAINNSWYDPRIDTLDCFSAYVPVFDALEAAGVAVVFSAGNEGPEPMTITPPHNINTDEVNSFTVGALNGNSNALGIADFSSRGPAQCEGTGSLLIKPEVSAPGVSVRSCVRDGGYEFFSGTSMASPHVSGAILLLKEAFPYLTGHEVKLALYRTCRDLGTSGEDNVYGMGLIDTEAAFQYLVDQGNTPVDPIRPVNDVMLIDVAIESSYCSGQLYGQLYIENGGSETLESYDLEVVLSGPENRVEATSFSGLALATGEREQINLPNFEDLSEGDYWLNVSLKTPNDKEDDRELNNKLQRKIRIFADKEIEATIEALDGEGACSGARVVLRSSDSGAAEVRWYDAPEMGNLIGVGDAYLTPAFFLDQTYYADWIWSANSGLEEMDESTSTIDNLNDGSIRFDCLSPFTLLSVKVYADQPGPRIITLKNNFGISIANKTVVLGQGEQVVALNFNVPVGNDHLIELGDGRSLFYNTEGASYPYEVEKVLRITGPGKADVAPDAYYYFYDWQIEYGYWCGRKAVELTRLTDNEVPSVTINSDNISGEAPLALDFSSTVTGDISSWYWAFDDQNSSTEANDASHTYDLPGNYMVSLTVEDVNGCTNADTLLVTVTEAPVSANNVIRPSIDWKVFPNPLNQQVNVHLQLSTIQDIQLNLLDAQGRRLRTLARERGQGFQRAFDLSELAEGLYFMEIQTAQGRELQKLVKM
ncbi:MAG: S8 family serine peptidase [Bacteroidota bacterium]